MLRNLFITLFFSAIIISAGYFSYFSACEYERKSENLSERLHTMPKMISFLKYLAEYASMGKYTGYSEEIKELNEIVSEARQQKQNANLATLIFFGISAIFLFSSYIFDQSRQFFIAAIWLISLYSLIIGLFAPILMIVSYKDIPVIGHIIFSFQSKGIITTIKTLFTSGNMLVAIPLSLFSVIVPFLKNLVMGLALLDSRQSAFVDMIKRIGKWSMADVFVVALLLTYFTINKDKSTNAEIQIGFYYFLGYVVLSMIASHLLMHSKKDQKNPFDDDFDPWSTSIKKSSELDYNDPFR